MEHTTVGCMVHGAKPRPFASSSVNRIAGAHGVQQRLEIIALELRRTKSPHGQIRCWIRRSRNCRSVRACAVAHDLREIICSGHTCTHVRRMGAHEATRDGFCN